MPDPSPWAVVNEYNKTVVTTAAAFLAFTATFAPEPILETHPSAWGYILLASWIMLIAAVGAALLASALLTNFLREEDTSLAMRKRSKAMFAANVSYFSLFVAAGLFLTAVFGGATKNGAAAVGIGRAATDALAAFDSSLASRASVVAVDADSTRTQWNVTFAAGHDTATVRLRANDLSFAGFER